MQSTLQQFREKKYIYTINQVWWYKPVIPAPQRQADHKLKAMLCYTVKPWLNYLLPYPTPKKRKKEKKSIYIKNNKANVAKCHKLGDLGRW
jgi:hypothetical protein